MPERTNNEQSASSPVWRSAIQGIIIFFAAQMLMKQFVGDGNQGASTGGGAVGEIPAFDERPDAFDAGATFSPIPQKIAPMWMADTSLDISVYVSPSFVMPPLAAAPKEMQVVKEKGFKLGDFGDERHIDTSFTVPEEVQQNGTLWAHYYVAISGHPLDPMAKGYDPAKAYHFTRPLNQFLAKKKAAKTKKLLGNSEVGGEVEPEPEPEPQGRAIASYYHPNVTLSIIPDSGVLVFPTLHPALRQWVQLESTAARDSSGQNGWYYPVIYVNTFWQLRSHMTELNSTVKTLPLHITLNTLSNWKFSIYSSIDEGMKQSARQAASGQGLGVGSDGSEFEEFKRVLVETNIYLLGTTGIVTILHMVFEMLAFKSDISHWKNKKDNVGISVRSILANVFMQTIILLYLLDNSEGTSWMIFFGQGMGILLEAWKITKTVDVRVRPNPPGSLFPYRITFEDKHKLSETEQKTKEYDQIAFKYLYMVAVPLLGAYAVYSVLYDTHKSWYSFIITTLVGSVYAYGFLMMVPSLYINYRLKSVAHMPAKAMTYKFLNTFIDDLFAFTIKMPTLHRLATLRDDVIFFIYLYQSYKYRVDYTRVNEFGQGGAEGEEAKKDEGSDVAGASKGEEGVVVKSGSDAMEGGRKRK
ncbi:hypothetical protein FGG08_003191 [Glutinoglossum americanum]|uniref:Cleft lip and palate transmembrane 1 n=1 Tax=Glutinoglossum americanum TaxID=1670608 RepID=A0A9P8HYV1_9PEZI|nr:hypothetical protein FGG08_003191 [Glutinoglossum americanum]